MSTFDELVSEIYGAHIREITEAGGVPRKRARSVVAAIRRRRAVRAGTATGLSLLAVGAVAVGAMALRPADDAVPVGFPTPPAGAPAWCDLSTYPQVNPAAIGALRYDGRIYANYADNVFVYVAPDGTRQVLEPDANGEVSVTPPDGGRPIYGPTAPDGWTFMEVDYSQDSGGGRNLSDGGDPGLLYEWTTTVPDVVPVGVDINNLSQQLAIAIGLGGTGFNPWAYADGAVVEQVFRWTDGHTRVERLTSELSAAAALQDTAGLASVSLRVRNLPGGEEFEMTSTYDPAKTWNAACVAGGHAPSSTRPVTSPSSTPYLEGPESTVFRCLAALPAKAEDAIETTATLVSGEQRVSYAGIATEFDTNGSSFNFGSRGVLATSEYQLTRSIVDFEYKPQPPGWGSVWGNIDQSPSPDGTTWGNGVVTFAALAWVSGDGVIVGREVVTTDPDGLDQGSGRIEVWAGPEASGRANVSYLVPNVDTVGVACDGADRNAIETASLVWLEGYGPDADEMTWSWTRVSPPSTN